MDIQLIITIILDIIALLLVFEIIKVLLKVGDALNNESREIEKSKDIQLAVEDSGQLRFSPKDQRVDFLNEKRNYIYFKFIKVGMVTVGLGIWFLFIGFIIR